MPKNLNISQIITILESGNFDELIGVGEDDHFECKAEPYRIEDELGCCRFGGHPLTLIQPSFRTP